MNQLIFRTVHGSRLYGFEHANSDYDYYEVYEGDGRHLHNSIIGDVDTVRGSLEAFVTRAMSGSHQSCEALFSPVKEWAPGMEAKWGAYINGLRVCGGDVFAKYERTIRKFCYGDFKRRRHAFRLLGDMNELRRNGRFDPMMYMWEVKYATALAIEHEGDALVKRLGLPMRHTQVDAFTGFAIAA